MYRQNDEYLKKLKKLIRREFNRLSVMGLDELNRMRTKEITTEMFERLTEYNQRNYEKIANYVRRYYYRTWLFPEEKKKANEKKWLATALVASVLASYNPVTTYLYKPETQRKRLRLAEVIGTSVAFHDRKMYRDGLSKSANLWYTQSMQYSLDIADESARQTMKDAGITRVKWVAEKDDRTCADCKELDGTIFDIDSVPEKPHYNCRCMIIPYREN